MVDKIGLDPEFMIIDTKYNELLSADRFSFLSTVNRSVGRDGCARIVEMRPAPCSINSINKGYNTIESLLYVLKNFFDKKFTDNGRMKLIAGTGYYNGKFFSSIGGHIHFGNQYLKKNNVRNRFGRLCDLYIMTILNSLLPPKEIHSRLHDYGRLSDLRVQDHGIEYRPPYSWIISPFLVKGILSLSALILNSYKILKMDDDLYDKLVKFYGGGSTNILYEIFPFVKRNLLKVMKYKSPNQYQNKHIITLFNLIENKKMIKSKDIFYNFGMHEINKNTRNIVVCYEDYKESNYKKFIGYIGRYIRIEPIKKVDDKERKFIIGYTKSLHHDILMNKKLRAHYSNKAWYIRIRYEDTLKLQHFPYDNKSEDYHIKFNNLAIAHLNNNSCWEKIADEIKYILRILKCVESS